VEGFLRERTKEVFDERMNTTSEWH